MARWPVFASLLSLASCFALSGTAGPVKGPQLPFSSQDVDIPLDSLASGVEPAVLTFQPVDPAKAFEMNASVPNASGPIFPAAPFKATMGEAGIGTRLTALECLASAVYYEAGSESSVGQRAVAQVVLNRVRHPAYPHSVCGVVFQGSERTTGCQFTFTCDGSLVRRSPSEKAWERAQSIAELALRGVVDPSVGLATHYHTDWVVPNWSGSLDKIAQIGSHLFFRFRQYR